ncbi:MAG TPA: hypothetical protein VH281_08965 [Gaiellaceae bacterium]|jgi:hypothetical protein
MPGAAGKGDTVLFEVSDFDLCLQLFERLREHWPTYLLGRRDVRFVAVSIDPDDVSMEMLLHTVSEWAGEVGMLLVPFHIGEQTSVVIAKAPESPET